MADRAHWDERYRTVGSNAVPWFEERPTVSLELLEAAGVGPGDSVIDVGGGASLLVDHLLAAGHTDVSVLDISSAAIEQARTRLGDPPQVTWLVEDLVRWEPARRWAAWHDRAVLHFLVDDADRAAYTSLLGRALLPGGGFVIGTFAEDGPTECSALPVRRYAPDELDALVALAGDVEITERRRHVHRTPGGVDQPFNWIAGRLRS